MGPVGDLGGAPFAGSLDGFAFPASSGPPARAQQVLERLSLDGLAHRALGTEAGHHRAVRAPQRGCVRIAGQLEAVAFW